MCPNCKHVNGELNDALTIKRYNDMKEKVRGYLQKCRDETIKRESEIKALDYYRRLIACGGRPHVMDNNPLGFYRCDACGKTAFGKAWRCLDCKDKDNFEFEVCVKCYTNKGVEKMHLKGHKFECIGDDVADEQPEEETPPKAEPKTAAPEKKRMALKKTKRTHARLPVRKASKKASKKATVKASRHNATASKAEPKGKAKRIHIVDTDSEEENESGSHGDADSTIEPPALLRGHDFRLLPQCCKVYFVNARILRKFVGIDVPFIGYVKHLVLCPVDRVLYAIEYEDEENVLNDTSEDCTYDDLVAWRTAYIQEIDYGLEDVDDVCRKSEKHGKNGKFLPCLYKAGHAGLCTNARGDVYIAANRKWVAPEVNVRGTKRLLLDFNKKDSNYTVSSRDRMSYEVVGFGDIIFRTKSLHETRKRPDALQRPDPLSSSSAKLPKSKKRASVQNADAEKRPRPAAVSKSPPKVDLTKLANGSLIDPYKPVGPSGRVGLFFSPKDVSNVLKDFSRHIDDVIDIWQHKGGLCVALKMGLGPSEVENLWKLVQKCRHFDAHSTLYVVCSAVKNSGTMGILKHLCTANAESYCNLLAEMVRTASKNDGSLRAAARSASKALISALVANKHANAMAAVADALETTKEEEEFRAMVSRA